MSNRLLDFRFHKVDRKGLFLADISDYVASGSMRMDEDLKVKFQGRFLFREEGVIEYLAEYLMPVLRITEDGVTTEYELTVFRLGWPSTTHTPINSRGAVAAYDLSVHLVEDLFSEPYTVVAGSNAVLAARTIAASVGFTDADGFVPIFETINFPDVATCLQADMSWEVGTSKYDAIAALLDAANCWPPWVEGRAWLTSAVRQSLAEVTPAVTYATDATSIVLPEGVVVDSDATSFANKVVLAVTNPDMTRENLLTNPEFEDPFSGIWDAGSSGTLTQQEEVEDENYVYHGLYSAKWTPGAQNGSVQHLPDINVYPGRIYVLECRIQGLETDTFEARWEDGAGWTSMGAAAALGSNGWVSFRKEFTPDEAVIKTVEVRNTTASPTAFYADSWLLAERDQPVPIYAEATNNNPDSPTSTVKLGRTIAKVMRLQNIQTQALADARALLELERAASVYVKAKLPTRLDPGRGIHEVYNLDIQRNGEQLLGGKWWCSAWQMDLAVGGVMAHELARVEAI